MASRALRLEVDREVADALSDALLEAGAQSVAIEPTDATSAVLSALFAETADAEAALRSALATCGQPTTVNVAVHALADEDWIRRSQSQFTPLELERLWIGATWHEPPASRKRVIRIDPGLAFGTGSHPTTKLVLRFLQRALQGGERILDYGSGSGVLAIAAAKLGAAQVTAVDIDPKALAVTEENAKANGVAISVYAPEGLPPGRYDVIVANILAQPLIELAPTLMARAEQGACIALAGLLESQAADVGRAYGAFAMRVDDAEDGWALLVGKRR
jgi:ribosomal protein L11 methyltransferase